MVKLNPAGVGVCLWLATVVTAATTRQATRIPDIPRTQKESPLFHLWEQGLKNQKKSADQTIRSVTPVPKTYLAPEYFVVTNWVPQDSAHPLYVSQYADLLREILLDYMTEEEVKPDDPRMSQPGGLTVTNINGKTLTFTRDASGFKVNGKKVTESRTDTDGTATYILEDDLFEHGKKVNTAWSAYIKTVPVYDPFGTLISGPLEPPPPPPPVRVHPVDPATS